MDSHSSKSRTLGLLPVLGAVVDMQDLHGFRFHRVNHDV